MSTYPYSGDTTKPAVTAGRTSLVGAAVLNPGFAVDQAADVPGRFRTYAPELEITGGSTVEESAELELELTATFQGRHEEIEEDVTADATWTTSDATKATVSGGTVTGVAEGSATITATYRGVSVTLAVTVTAAG